MKKQIGSVLALYPTPLTVVGAMVASRPNWLLAGHLGIIGHDRVMVSLSDTHYTNRGIRETGALSVNIVDEVMTKRPCPWPARWKTSTKPRALRTLSVKLPPHMRRRPC